MDLSLEEWRQDIGLSYAELAERLGVAGATQARRYALGIVEASPDLKELARKASGGRVTPNGFHRARLDWLRRAETPAAPETSPEVAELPVIEPCQDRVGLADAEETAA